MGCWPAHGDEKRLSSNYSRRKRRPPLCHLDRSSEGAEWRDLRCQRSFPGNVFRPEKSWAFGPPTVMKNVCPATTLAGTAVLPFVISTGAPKERSGEICGVSGPFLEMFFDRRSHGPLPAHGDEKRLSSNSSRWKRRPPLCHLDRSSEGA